MTKKLARYFLQGLVFLAPIALTVWILVAVFLQVDGWLGLPVPGLGVLVVLAATTLLGFLLSNIISRTVLSIVERLLARLPLVRLLHTSMKDLMSAFVGDKRRFGKPVAVELIPGSGTRVLGFITRESLAQPELGDAVAVYLPQSFNFAGQLVIVPRDRVFPLAMDGTAMMSFVVSGGVTGQQAV